MADQTHGLEPGTRFVMNPDIIEPLAVIDLLLANPEAAIDALAILIRSMAELKAAQEMEAVW